MSRALLAFGLAAAGGVLLALALIAVAGRPTPSQTLSGRVEGARERSTVIVMASRNPCAQPGRRPLALAWTEVSGRDWELVVPHIGPGVAYVCAYDRAPGMDVRGPYERWDQLRLTVTQGRAGAAAGLVLRLRPGLPVFTDGRGRR